MTKGTGIMNQMYKDCCGLGLHWILAFVIIAILTVATCMKEQHMLLASNPTVIAMKQSARMVQ